MLKVKSFSIFQRTKLQIELQQVQSDMAGILKKCHRDSQKLRKISKNLEQRLNLSLVEFGSINTYGVDLDPSFNQDPQQFIVRMQVAKK